MYLDSALTFCSPLQWKYMFSFLEWKNERTRIISLAMDTKAKQ